MRALSPYFKPSILDKVNYTRIIEPNKTATVEWISVYVTVTSKLEQKLYIAPLQLDWPTNKAYHVLCAVLFMNTELHLNNSQSSGMIMHDAGDDCWMTDIAGINESNLNCGRRHRHHSTIVSRPTFQCSLIGQHSIPITGEYQPSNKNQSLAYVCAEFQKHQSDYRYDSSEKWKVSYKCLNEFVCCVLCAC